MMTGKRAHPSRDLQPLHPPALDRVIRTCLAEDPDARWQSIHDVRMGLEWSSEIRTPARTDSQLLQSTSRERAAWALAAVFIVISIAFAALNWLGRSASRNGSEVVRFAVNPPDKTVFSSSVNATVPVPQFALSPNGHAIAFAASAPGTKPSLWVRYFDDVTPRPLSGTEGAQNPFWSPDNLWVGFV